MKPLGRKPTRMNDAAVRPTTASVTLMRCFSAYCAQRM
jgi:hypothetical protein